MQFHEKLINCTAVFYVLPQHKMFLWLVERDYGFIRTGLQTVT